MSISAIGNTTPNYTPQKTGGQDNVAQLDSQLDALSKQLKEIKQNDKLEPEKKKKQIANIEKKMAEIEKRISQIKQKNHNDENQIEHVKDEDLSKKELSPNHLINEYV